MATTVSAPLLMLTIFFILNSIPIPSFSCPFNQKQALLHFKSTLTTIDHSSSYHMELLESWNLTSDCCSWEEVKCGGTETVTELHLDGVVGALLDDNSAPVFSNILAPLFHIRSLKLLRVSSNQLHGEIPGDGFTNLTELVHLEMHNNYFNGSIPRQLFWLTNLRYLDMSHNMLDGKLGPQLGSLRNLTTLKLSGNYFEGPVPSQLYELESLQVLDLSANFLSGKIPQEIGNLTKLRELSLDNNRFSGGIPSSIVNLSKVESMGLSGNLLSTQILTSIGILSSITTLDLSKNQLTGLIPSSMQNLSKLKILRLDDNMLHGEIPTWFFNISTLKTLFIGGKGNGLIWNNDAMIVPRCSLGQISMPSCNIAGRIPKWLSAQKDLLWLDLSKNKLEGRFPDMLTKGRLQMINLSGNNLSGVLPPSLFENLDIIILDLSQNKFSGELPENIGNASMIMYLCLSENNFSGQIPMSISNLYFLNSLDLSKNRLSGRIPVLGDGLVNLDLSYNNLSGKIPTSFSKGIEVLFLGGNKLCGNMPWNLTELFELKLLDIRDNYITGNLQDNLPQISTLEVLILRNNSLVGYIPSSISNLSSLRLLDLSHNYLTASIPQEIGNLSRMINASPISTPSQISPSTSDHVFGDVIVSGDLVVNWKKSFNRLASRTLENHILLDLSYNKISGEIPSSLGNLKAIKQLNISYNKISGHIPVSFGNLENIESLDLSHNEISGSIPQSLVKLSQLTLLDVSNNKLTGKIPVGGQMSSMDELSYFVNNSGLCGIQMRAPCPEDIPRQLERRDKEDEKESWFLWEGTWVGFPVGFFSSILVMGYFLNFLLLFKIW